MKIGSTHKKTKAINASGNKLKKIKLGLRAI